MLNLSSPLYTLSATTTSASITISQPHLTNDTLQISNAGAQSVYVQSGTGSVTAVYPTSSGTAFKNGAVIPANQTILFKKNPNHETLAVIRPAGASAANIYVKIGADI
jgi:hypothetical protein